MFFFTVGYCQSRTAHTPMLTSAELVSNLQIQSRPLRLETNAEQLFIVGRNNCGLPEWQHQKACLRETILHLYLFYLFIRTMQIEHIFVKTRGGNCLLLPTCSYGPGYGLMGIGGSYSSKVVEQWQKRPFHFSRCSYMWDGQNWWIRWSCGQSIGVMCLNFDVPVSGTTQAREFWMCCILFKFVSKLQKFSLLETSEFARAVVTERGGRRWLISQMSLIWKWKHLDKVCEWYVRIKDEVHIMSRLGCHNRVHQNVSLHISFLIFYGSLIGCIILLPQEVVLWLVIGYKNTISGGSSIMQPIRIPENTRNVILLMNLITER